MSKYTRLTIDALLFAAFLVASSPAVTGLAIHEWLSLAIATPVLLHLVINWDWVRRAAVTFWGKLRHTSRVNLVVDAALFIVTIAVMLSGVMVSQVISGALGITMGTTPAWYVVHSWAANATIVLLLTHFALHSRWVANVVRSSLADPAPAAEQLHRAA